MDAERELDAEVAEWVMGWHTEERTNEKGEEFTELYDYDDTLVGSKWGVCPLAEFDEIPHYSTDIAAAWTVAEHYDLSVFNIGGALYAGRFDSDLGWFLCQSGIDGSIEYGAHGDTAPEAICRAALAVVDAQEEA